jgi:hypothetical protein
VRAAQNVDRVELEDPDAIDHPSKVSDINPTRWPRAGESLRRQRDPPRRIDRDRLTRQASSRSCHSLSLEQRSRQFGDRPACLVEREAVLAPEPEEGLEAGEHMQGSGGPGRAKAWA